MRSRASFGRVSTFRQSKGCDSLRNTDDLLVCGLVDHDCGTGLGSLMPQQPMAKAFGCLTALLSTAERLRRVLSRTESLPDMMQEKFASCNHPSVKIGCRKQALAQACAVCSPVSWGFERTRDVSTACPTP